MPARWRRPSVLWWNTRTARKPAAKPRTRRCKPGRGCAARRWLSVIEGAPPEWEAGEGGAARRPPSSASVGKPFDLFLEVQLFRLHARNGDRVVGVVGFFLANARVQIRVALAQRRDVGFLV